MRRALYVITSLPGVSALMFGLRSKTANSQKP